MTEPVKRYRFSRCKLHFDPYVCLCGPLAVANGEFVLHSDYARLEQALEHIRDWYNAYPRGFEGGIFDEPDMKEVRRLLGDDLLTKLSAHNFRHVLNGIKGYVDAALAPAQEQPQDGGEHE